MLRPVFSTLAVLFALTISATAARAQSAPTPVVSGSLRHPSTNAAWGTWEGFTTTTNTFGFWARFRTPNGHVYTVVPFETTADGQVACWYIEYNIVGSADPNRSEGWQWQEVAGGRVLINPATATEATIDGQMWQTYTMVAYTRVADDNPRANPIRFSVP